MKLFFIPLPKQANFIYTCPRTRHMLRQGFDKISEVEIVEYPSLADFFCLDYVPHDGQNKYIKDCISEYNPKKLIVIDNSDEHDIFYTDEYFLYFKRSLWTTEGWRRKPSPSKFRERVHWFDYGLIDEFYQPEIQFKDRDIDWGCYLRPSCYWRQLLLQMISNSNLSHKMVGPINSGLRSNQFDINIDPTYFNHLARTRFLFSCQPHGWVSDSRWCEAIANKCLLFIDKIYIQHDYPLINNIHCLEYDLSPIGVEKLKLDIEILINNGDINNIAEEGYKYCKEFHSSKARCQYILKTINEYT